MSPPTRPEPVGCWWSSCLTQLLTVAVHHAEVWFRLGVRVYVHVLLCVVKVGEATGGEVPIEDMHDIKGGKLFDRMERHVQSPRVEVGEGAVQDGVGVRPGANDNVFLTGVVHHLTGF